MQTEAIQTDTDVWLDLLLQTRKEQKQYYTQFYNEKNEIGSMMRFRRYLLEEVGRGQSSDLKQQIIISYNKSNFYLLKYLLQEVFL